MDYNFDEEDIKFDSLYVALKFQFVSMVAAVIQGCTGAMGTISGPVFIYFGMNTQVMSATSPYTTMLASMVMIIEVIIAGELHY